VFLGFFVLGAGGHGWNPFAFVYYLAYPTAFVLDLIPRSWGPENIWILSFSFFLAGLIQWAFIGYLFDKLLGRKRAK
jgi:hypothetical protein